MGEQYPDRGTRNVTEDGKYYTCRKCGFVNNEDETFVAQVFQDAGDSIVITNGDPRVVKGCPFCGTVLSR